MLKPTKDETLVVTQGTWPLAERSKADVVYDLTNSWFGIPLDYTGPGANDYDTPSSTILPPPDKNDIDRRLETL